ncbi:hypothetical protein ACFIQF_12955 [Comamonas sp. J-3]|uniref:hypothetical protein n=1 Tax=Comamonas trifloxystrobinivorans TaxID=3350256 RepID=UPI00372AE687
MNSQKNIARMAMQAKPCQNCRDNFPLPKAEDYFDQQVIAGYTARRMACQACPEEEKPCLPRPNNDQAQRHQVVMQALMQVETLAETLLKLVPNQPENCAVHTLLRRIAALNTAAMGGVLDDGEDLVVLQQIVGGSNEH